MPRRATGAVIERRGPTGRTFAIRFRAYGRRHYLTLGSEADGWTRQRAETELANVMADVRRGIWRPPPADQAAAQKVDPTFHEFATDWFERLHHEGLSPNTLADYEWQLSLHLLPFFADHRLSEITIAEVDRYRQAKVREGRLSPTSINKTIQRLGQILEIAVERELITRNPAKGKRRRLKQSRPPRTWLDRADQIAALLGAAGELDADARVDRRASSRRAILSVLTFAGMRIGEALALRWSDVDLAGGRLRVRAAKTDTGIREVDLLPALRDELATYRARARFTAPEDFVFPTESGERQNASNVRNRVLTKSAERANRCLAERDLAPLPERLTPHSLRRTYASLLIAKGDELPLRDGAARPRRPEDDARRLRPPDAPHAGRARAPARPRRGR